MRISKSEWRPATPAAFIACMLLVGCGGGGGGGGGGSATTVQGQVFLVSTDQAPSPPATVTINGASVMTDTSGNFTLSNVSSTATSITISATGGITLTQTLPTLTKNQANNLGPIFLAATGSGYTSSASGTVVRADTLAILPGAIVVINGLKATADANGMFTINSLPVGLGGPGITVGNATATGFDNEPIVIDPPLVTGANSLGQIEVPPPVGGIPGGPVNILGTISLKGQTDFSGTIVTLINTTTNQSLGSETTGSNGAYGFWVIAGQYTVQAVHTGFQTQSQNITLARPDQPQTVNLTLSP